MGPYRRTLASTRLHGYLQDRVDEQLREVDARLPRWLKTNAPHIRRGLVIRDSLPAPRRWLAMKLADPAFLAVDVAAIDKPWVAAARARMPVYTWTVRTREQRRLALLHADALIWEADGRP